MRRIRVLVVDDAVAVRRLVAEVLGADPALEVAGTAASGRIALAKIPQVLPDLVTLDIEMPDMDGIQTLAAIRDARPDLPVIMFSTLTRRGAGATIDALMMGARDYVTKPSGTEGAAAALASVRDQLVPRIKALCRGVLEGREAPAARAPEVLPDPAATDRRSVEIVAIGVSTGGPNALSMLLPRLPDDFPVPILIVQHMPALFTGLLAARLAAQCRLRVSEGLEGRALEPGQIWIAPGDRHMVVQRTGSQATLGLGGGPPENSCRPAADVLFRSVAEAYGERALAVVLTGMGQDGLRGCARIREAGGRVLVQDEATSVVWGMPGLVARAGLADRIVPLHDLAPEILRLVLRGRRPHAGAAETRDSGLLVGGGRR